MATRKVTFKELAFLDMLAKMNTSVEAAALDLSRAHEIYANSVAAGSDARKQLDATAKVFEEFWRTHTFG